MRRLLAATALITLLGASGTTPPQGTPERDLRLLEPFVDSVMAAEMTNGHIPGATFIFVRNGRVMFAKGYGSASLEPLRPVLPDSTIWRIGSISKVFTALAVLQLADRGTIDLGTDIRRYIRSVEIPATFPEPITASHLVTHTAGFDEIRPGTQAADSAGVLPLTEFLRPRMVRLWPPGRVIMYSTYGITLGGLLIEDVSRMAFETYMRRNIWNPLGMTQTAITRPVNSRWVAKGYEYDGNATVPARWEWYHTTPASSIGSTATDMARFMVAIMDGQIGGARVLSDAAAKQFRQRHFSMDPRLGGIAYGLWEELPSKYGVRILTHGGNMEGFSSDMVMIPEERSGWFVVNHVEGSRLRENLKWAILDRFWRVANYKPHVPTTSRDFLARADAYTGWYGWNVCCHTCPGGRTSSWFDVKSDSTGALSFTGRRWMEVAPRFFLREDGNDSLVFVPDSTGRITHLAWGGFGVYERIPGPPR